MNNQRTNKQITLSRAQVRAVDQISIEEFGIRGVVLMENAGRGCAEILLSREIRGLVVICCGKGNNGGDGLVIARHLENQGLPVQVLLLAAPHELSPDASENLRILSHMETSITIHSGPLQLQEFKSSLASAAWIVDALLGTGVRGEVREPYRSAIAEINNSQKPVLAVDLPSGMDCDTGIPLGICIRAEVTATFVGMKSGFQNTSAQQFLGEVVVIDIGAPRQAIERAKEGGSP